jgi:hypothetical protein
MAGVVVADQLRLVRRPLDFQIETPAKRLTSLGPERGSEVGKRRGRWERATCIAFFQSPIVSWLSRLSSFFPNNRAGPIDSTLTHEVPNV